MCDCLLFGLCQVGLKTNSKFRSCSSTLRKKNPIKPSNLKHSPAKFWEREYGGTSARGCCRLQWFSADIPQKLLHLKKLKAKLCYYFEGIDIVSSQGFWGILWAVIKAFVLQKHWKYFLKAHWDGNPVSLGTEHITKSIFLTISEIKAGNGNCRERWKAYSPQIPALAAQRLELAASGERAGVSAHPQSAEDA